TGLGYSLALAITLRRNRANFRTGPLTGRHLAHAFEDGVPVVDLAVLGMDHDVLDPGLGIGGDALLHHADVAAVPVAAHRDGEFGLGAVAAQALDHLGRLGRRHLAAVPAVADPDGAAVRRFAAAAVPHLDRADRLRQHRHLPDLGRDVSGLEGHRVLRPHRLHHRDAFVHAPAALVERHAEGGEFRF